jgi:hypothetical protein
MRSHRLGCGDRSEKGFAGCEMSCHCEGINGDVRTKDGNRGIKGLQVSEKPFMINGFCSKLWFQSGSAQPGFSVKY